MKIEYEIAGRHRRGEMENFITANPALTRAAAQTLWIDQRFGNWIADNITAGFTIYETTELGFRVEFAEDEHALDFVQKLGGRRLEA